MTTQSTMLLVRMDNELKREATQAPDRSLAL